MQTLTNKNATAHQVCRCARCKSMYRFVDRLFEHQPGDFQIQTLDHWFGLTIRNNILKDLDEPTRESIFLFYSDLKVFLYDAWLSYTLIDKIEEWSQD